MGLASLCDGDALVDWPTGRLRHLDNSHSAVILLDDHFDACPYVLQRSMKVLSEFGFGHIDLRHIATIWTHPNWLALEL
jgi:hypothetical protein